MAEWEEKLNTILGDPEAMGQILSLAQSLGLSSRPEQEDHSPEEDGQTASLLSYVYPEHEPTC